MTNESKEIRIGLLLSKSSDGLAANAAYFTYLSRFGMVIPVSPLDEKVQTDLNLMVLPGGADVNPARYGQKPGFYTGNPNLFFDWWDEHVLPRYIDARVPLFGICRGLQTLNIALGGSLQQDIAQSWSNLRSDTVDTLDVLQGSESMVPRDILYGTTGQIVKKYKVNSMHHQGFTTDQKGKDVIPFLVNDTHRNVEAFIVRDKPIIAVQWHPEEIADIVSGRCIRFLIKQSQSR